MIKISSCSLVLLLSLLLSLSVAPTRAAPASSLKERRDLLPPIFLPSQQSVIPLKEGDGSLCVLVRVTESTRSSLATLIQTLFVATELVASNLKVSSHLEVFLLNTEKLTDDAYNNEVEVELVRTAAWANRLRPDHITRALTLSELGVPNNLLVTPNASIIASAYALEHLFTNPEDQGGRKHCTHFSLTNADHLHSNAWLLSVMPEIHAKKKLIVVGFVGAATGFHERIPVPGMNTSDLLSAVYAADYISQYRFLKYTGDTTYKNKKQHSTSDLLNNNDTTPSELLFNKDFFAHCVNVTESQQVALIDKLLLFYP